MSEEVKQKKILITKLLGKSGFLFFFIGVLLIIGGCSLIEDGGGGIIDSDNWFVILVVGLTLCILGAVAQSIIEIVKPFIARNQGEGNAAKKTLTAGNQWEWNASEEPLAVVNKGKENTTKNALFSGIGCWFFLIGLLLIIGGCSQMELDGYSYNLRGWDKWGSVVMIGVTLFLVGPVIQLIIWLGKKLGKAMIWLGKKLGKAKGNNP